MNFMKSSRLNSLIKVDESTKKQPFVEFFHNLVKKQKGNNLKSILSRNSCKSYFGLQKFFIVHSIAINLFCDISADFISIVLCFN